MINIKRIEDTVVFEIEQDNYKGNISLTLNTVKFEVSEISNLIAFKNIHTDNYITSDLIDKITIDSNSTSKETIMEDLSDVLYANGVDLSDYYTKEEIDNKRYVTDVSIENDEAITSYVNNISYLAITSCIYGVSGKLYCGTTNGIYILNNDFSLTKVGSSSSNYGNPFIYNNQLMFKYSSGIAIVNEEDDTIIFKLPPNNKSFNATLVTKNNVLYGCGQQSTWSGGLWYYENDGWVQIDGKFNLNSMVEDKNGNVYFQGTSNSLVVKKSNPITNILSSSLPSGGVGFIKDKYENVYSIGRNVYKLTSPDDDSWELINENIGSSLNYINYMGDLYISSLTNKSLYKLNYETNTFEFFQSVNDEVLGGFTPLFGIGGDNNLYMYSGNGMLKMVDGLFQPFYSGKRIYSTFGTKQNETIFGCYNGEILKLNAPKYWMRTKGAWIEYNSSDYYTKKEVDDLIKTIEGVSVARCPISKINLDSTEFQAIDESDDEGKTFKIYRNGNVVNMTISLTSTGNIRSGDNSVLIGGIPYGYRPIGVVRFNGIYYDATSTLDNEFYQITIYPNSTDMNIKVFSTVVYGAIFNMNVSYITNDDFPTEDVI